MSPNTDNQIEPNDSAQLAEDFLNTAKVLFKENNIPEAVQHMDLALTLSENKLDYLIQKLELLYQFESFAEYVSTFNTQTKLLFEQLDLKQFCYFLDCYIKLLVISEEELVAMLTEAGVPAVLSNLYTDILNDKIVEFELQAYYLYSEQNYKAALDYGHLALKVVEPNLELLLLEARCFSELGLIAQSIDRYEKICLAYPEDKHAYLELARIYYISQSYSEAVALFKNAISYGYDEKICLEAIATCYYRLKNYNLATIYYKKYLTYAEDVSDIHIKIADCYKLLKEPALEKKHLKLAKNPNRLLFQNIIMALLVLIGIISLIIILQVYGIV